MLVFDLREIGNRLLAARKRQGLTQAETAEKAGLADRTYADIERGSVNMRIDTALKICRALDLTPDEIFTTDDRESDAARAAVIERLDRCGANARKTAVRLLDVYLRSLD